MSSWRRLSVSWAPTKARDRVKAALGRPIWKPSVTHELATRMVAEQVGVPASWVMLTNSCTSALAAAYEFCGRSSHTAPILTYSATTAPARAMAHLVEEVDVDDEGWPSLVRPTTAVDLWGRAYPAGEDDPPRVLDAAHRYAGSEHAGLAKQGTFICYSFGPQKEVATPQGGALIWKGMENAEARASVEAFLMYGQRGRVPTSRGGICGYMPETTSALLVPQLAGSHRERMWRYRQQALEAYENFLGELLMTKPGAASGHLAVVRMPDEGTAKSVRWKLDQLQIQWGHHYPVAPQHADTNAAALSKRIISLPCHHAMSPHDAARVAKVVLTA